MKKIIFIISIFIVVTLVISTGMGIIGSTISNVSKNSKYEVIRASIYELNCDIPKELRGKTLRDTEIELIYNDEIIPVSYCYPQFPLEPIKQGVPLPKRIVLVTDPHKLIKGKYSLILKDKQGFSKTYNLIFRTTIYGPWSY